MSNNLGIWYREAISPTQTNISPPPLRKNFFEDESSTPLGDEGTQNSIDNCINRKTKIKISCEKISKEFFTENFITSDVKKYIEKSKLVDPEYKNITSKLKKDIPVLIFEDFNTTGVTGDPFTIKENISGKRNDFYAFWWQLYSGNKGEGTSTIKGGSVGVGRLTFAYSSNISTFFAFSVPKNNQDKKFFLGVGVFGKYSDQSEAKDSFCRYGHGGLGKFYPITEENKLKEFHEKFKLSRGFNEPGLSMIIPFPEKESCDLKSLKINLLERYRYSIYKDEVEIDINGDILSKDTLMPFIKKHLPEQLEKYAKYFNFLDQCSQLKGKDLCNINIEDNPREVKEYHISKEIITQWTQNFSLGKIIPCKFNFTIKKKDGPDAEASIKVYLQSSKSLGSNLGCDDIMRRTMPVSGERVFDGKDTFALTLIEDKETAEFARHSESENHKYFDFATLREKKIYNKESNPLSFIRKAAKSLNFLLLEQESQKTAADATRDFFSFGSKDPQSAGSKHGATKTGSDTKFKLPEYIFEDPKIHQIIKLEENGLTGFEIVGSDVMEITEKTIQKIEDIIALGEDEEEDDKNEKKAKPTKEELKRLKKQLEKLKKRKEGNCEDLFPSKVFVTIWEDMVKHKKGGSKFYDFKNDFNLVEDIGKEFQVSSSGVINKSEKLNKISFEVKNNSFKYRLLANKFKSGEGQPTDIGCNVQARRLDQ